jgi:hypothetical protein
VSRLLGEGRDVVEIRSERGPTRLRESHDYRVDGGTSTSSPPQQRSTPREGFGNALNDVARL